MHVRPVTEGQLVFAELVEVCGHTRSLPGRTSQRELVEDELLRARAPSHAFVLLSVEERGHRMRRPWLHNEGICRVFQQVSTTARGAKLHLSKRIQRQSVSKSRVFTLNGCKSAPPPWGFTSDP